MNSESQRNKMKTCLDFDPSLTKKSFSAHFKPFLLKKYFPKYLRNFQQAVKLHTVKSTVKKIKIIRKFRTYDGYYGSEWRPLLANKFKFLKQLSNTEQSSIQLLEKIKLLKNVTSFKFSLPTEPADTPPKQRCEENLVKAMKKMKSLNKLSSLEIDRITKIGLNLLQKFNSLPRLLSRLENLSLSYYLKYASEAEMIDYITENRNLLRYVTSLKLGLLCSPSHYEKFQNLADSCPNLRELSFEFCSQLVTYNQMDVRTFSRRYFPVKINYLEMLKKFNNLISLELNIADTFTFLKDFSLPGSTQNLTLYFEECLTKEIMLKIDSSFTDKNFLQIFEENPTLVGFYNNFQHLHSLESLKILLSSDLSPQDYQYQNYLLHQILKRVPSLKKLTSNFGTKSCLGLNKKVTSQIPLRDFYLPQLLESCQLFTQTLQTLKIGDREIIFSNFDLSSMRNKFPSLSTIDLGASFKNPDADISSVLEQIISLGDSIMAIKLLTFVNNNVKSLLSILQQLRRLHKPQNLKINLQIKFFGNKNLEEIGVFDALKELEEDYSELKGVSLEIFTFSVNSKPLKEFLTIYGKKFEKFEVVYWFG